MKFKVIMDNKTFVHQIDESQTVRDLYESIRAEVAMEVFIFRSSPRVLVEMTESPVRDVLTDLECLYLSLQAQSRGPSQTKVNSLSTQGLRFSVHTVPSDNSCLFHALSELLDAKSSGELRRMVADAILKSPEEFRAYIEMEPFKYSKWITSSGTWGGAPEIVVISRMYKTQVCVIDTDAFAPLYFGEEFKSMVYLAYTGDHYNPVFAKTPEGRPQHKFVPGDKEVHKCIVGAIKAWKASAHESIMQV